MSVGMTGRCMTGCHRHTGTASIIIILLYCTDSSLHCEQFKPDHYKILNKINLITIIVLQDLDDSLD